MEAAGPVSRVAARLVLRSSRGGSAAGAPPSLQPSSTSAQGPLPPGSAPIDSAQYESVSFGAGFEGTPRMHATAFVERAQAGSEVSGLPQQGSNAGTHDADGSQGEECEAQHGYDELPSNGCESDEDAALVAGDGTLEDNASVEVDDEGAEQDGEDAFETEEACRSEGIDDEEDGNDAHVEEGEHNQDAAMTFFQSMSYHSTAVPPGANISSLAHAQMQAMSHLASLIGYPSAAGTHTSDSNAALRAQEDGEESDEETSSDAAVAAAGGRRSNHSNDNHDSVQAQRQAAQVGVKRGRFKLTSRAQEPRTGGAASSAAAAAAEPGSEDVVLTLPPSLRQLWRLPALEVHTFRARAEASATEDSDDSEAANAYTSSADEGDDDDNGAACHPLTNKRARRTSDVPTVLSAGLLIACPCCLSARADALVAAEATLKAVCSKVVRVCDILASSDAERAFRRRVLVAWGVAGSLPPHAEQYLATCSSSVLARFHALEDAAARAAADASSPSSAHTIHMVGVMRTILRRAIELKADVRVLDEERIVQMLVCDDDLTVAEAAATEEEEEASITSAAVATSTAGAPSRSSPNSVSSTGSSGGVWGSWRVRLVRVEKILPTPERLEEPDIEPAGSGDHARDAAAAATATAASTGASATVPEFNRAPGGADDGRSPSQCHAGSPGTDDTDGGVGDGSTAPPPDAFLRRISARRSKPNVGVDDEQALHHLLRVRYSAPIEVTVHEERGRCVRTHAFIPRGAFVVEYRGQLISGAEIERREAAYSASGCGSYMFYFQHLGVQHCIDATAEREEYGIGRLINHSRKAPNLVPRKLVVDGVPRLALLARFDIGYGEELCYDYGETDAVTVRHLPWLQNT